MGNSSIKKNFTYQMIYQMLLLILPFITSPYIARIIGAEGLGKYSYAYSIAYYFILFSALGIQNYGNRIIAQSREEKEKLNSTFSDLTFLHVVISLIFLIAYIIYVMTIKEERVYAIIMIFYVISAVFDISWFYFGIEQFKLTVTRNTVIKILNVLSVFIFVKKAEDLWKYCLIMSLGMFFSQLSLWIPIRKYVSFIKPSCKGIKVHIKPMIILFIPAITVSLYKYMDKIMLGIMSDKVQLGYYENAEKVVNMPMSIIVSFGTVMLPKMSNTIANNKSKETNRYMDISMKYIMCLAFALAFGLAGIGKVFAPVFWGNEFSLSGNIIIGLSITIPFMAFANIIRTQYIIPVEKDAEYILSVVVGAVVNVLMNLWMIPKIGAMGATIGTICAEFFVCFIQAIIVRKALPIKKYFKYSLIFMFVGIVMFCGVYYIGAIWGTGLSTLFIQIISGGIFYLCISSIILYKIKDDMFISMTNKYKYKIKKKYEKKDKNN